VIHLPVHYLAGLLSSAVKGTITKIGLNLSIVLLGFFSFGWGVGWGGGGGAVVVGGVCLFDFVGARTGRGCGCNGGGMERRGGG